MQTESATSEATHRAYRSYTTCGDLRADHIGQRATLTWLGEPAARPWWPDLY